MHNENTSKHTYKYTHTHAHTHAYIEVLGTFQTKYEWFLVSDFIEDLSRIGPKLQKIIHNSMENRGSTPFYTKLVGGHTKFEANQRSCMRGKKCKKFTTTDTGWSLESHSLIKTNKVLYHSKYHVEFISWQKYQNCNESENHFKF